jgi:peroxiredoxin
MIKIRRDAARNARVAARVSAASTPAKGDNLNMSTWIVVATALLIVVVGALVLRPVESSGGSMSVLPGLRLGDSAPNFQLQDLDGNHVNLAGYRGRWLLLNFWGVTCVPCKSEMPALEEAYTRVQGGQHGGRPVILGIDGNIDTLDAIRKFIHGAHISYPVAVDTLLRTVMAYHIGGIPTTVLVDTKGKMRMMHVGPLTEPEIERALRGQIS